MLKQKQTSPNTKTEGNGNAGKMPVDELQVEKLIKSTISVNMTALEKAKAILVYRENSFLNEISGKLKEKMGDDFCTATVPAGPTELGEQDLSKLIEVFEMGGKGKLVINDDTVNKLLGEDSDGRPNYLNYKSEHVQSLMSKVILGTAAEFKGVLAEAARQAKDGGMKNVVIILGESQLSEYDLSDRAGFILASPLHSHGIVIEKDGVERRFSLEDQKLLGKEEIRMMFDFIAAPFREIGINAFPGVLVWGATLVFEDFDKLEFGACINNPKYTSLGWDSIYNAINARVSRLQKELEKSAYDNDEREALASEIGILNENLQAIKSSGLVKNADVFPNEAELNSKETAIFSDRHGLIGLRISTDGYGNVPVIERGGYVFLKHEMSIVEQIVPTSWGNGKHGICAKSVETEYLPLADTGDKVAVDVLAERFDSLIKLKLEKKR